MAYSFYLDGMLLPVAPEALQIKVNGKNETLVLMDQGEVNILKKRGLTEAAFDALLPNVRYPFARYPDGYHSADYYISKLEGLKDSISPFQFVVSRETAGGRWLYGTSLKVSLEEFTMKEDAGSYGTDVLVSLKLKQYRDYGTKTCRISGNTSMIVAARETSGAPSGNTYTVQEDESLWEISKRSYGDGSRYQELQSVNDISDPNNPPVGAVLQIPR